jgi:hypothetical protein
MFISIQQVRSYIYFDSSHKKWKEKDRVVDDSTELGKKVRLDTALNPVWTNNTDHRTIYSVALYSSSDDLKEEKKKVVVKENSDSTTTGENNVQPEKKRKGLGRLIQKIFKKKNK